MSEKLTPEYDKRDWPKGEWDNEPDRHEFVHAGFACLMVRNHSGAWCGYVGIPNTHPLYGIQYNKLYDMGKDPDVHGGLTYSDTCGGHICHVPQPGMPEDVWWFGFDCCHYNDLAPGLIATEAKYGLHLMAGELRGTYKNMQYVIDEVKDLANQLKEMENDNGR